MKDDELEGRWYQYGVFSPIMRLHSTKNEFNGKEPWRFRRDVAEMMKDFLRLRHQLIPYLYTMNYRFYKEGEPLVQPLYYRHEWRKVFGLVKNEYYFGKDFLVSPITRKQNPALHVGKVTTWLPEGSFVDFFTGVVYSGRRKMDMYRDISSIPVLVRTGTIIPMTEQISAGEVCRSPEQMYLRVFAGADGAFTMYEDDNDGMGYLDGDCVLTDYSLSWQEEVSEEDGGKKAPGKKRKCFRIGAARGNRGFIPAERSYKIELNAVEAEENTWRETLVTADSRTIPAQTVYNGTNGVLTVEIPPISVGTEICVCFPDSCRLRRNNVSELTFRFLNRAEMEFNRKAGLYETICKEPDGFRLLAELQSMELEPDLLGALTELITAQI